ncbi:MAG: hypothetical protein V3V92_06085 [Candidatus Hydrothermarchaeales archaeon]
MDPALVLGYFMPGVLFGFATIVLAGRFAFMMDFILISFLIAVIVGRVPFLSNLIELNYLTIIIFGLGFILGQILFVLQGERKSKDEDDQDG